ncbi:ROK family protein [Lacticaseibacillus sharpeae]|uniref:ROK family protein n=1 Tax=Lacticaseibacillus sharpeae TaxID=1626 RepID=UPI0006D28A8D|nr:ROK family protein [Lacticaseibacillus sharpeae]
MKSYVSFDIGGTSIKYGVVNGDGTVVARGHVATAPDRETNVAHLLDVVHTYQADYDIFGIGVSVPGIVDHDAT